MNPHVLTLHKKNGVVEHKNKHLLEVTRALLFQSNVPKFLWGEAVLTAAYLIIRLPSRVIGNQSPLDMLSQFYPESINSNCLPPKILGCTLYVHDHK